MRSGYFRIFLVILRGSQRICSVVVALFTTLKLVMARYCNGEIQRFSEYYREDTERIPDSITVYGERGEYTLCGYLLRDLSLVLRIEFREEELFRGFEEFPRKLKITRTEKANV